MRENDLMQIRKVLQSNIDIFYELIGEVEHALFRTKNEEYINRIKRIIDRL